jgi:hypothetical protein
MKTINESSKTVNTTHTFKDFLKESKEEMRYAFALVSKKWKNFRSDVAALSSSRRQREMEKQRAMLVDFCANPVQFVYRSVRRFISYLIHRAVTLSIIAIAAIMVYNFVQANPELIAQIAEFGKNACDTVIMAWEKMMQMIRDSNPFC